MDMSAQGHGGYELVIVRERYHRLIAGRVGDD